MDENIIPIREKIEKRKNRTLLVATENGRPLQKKNDPNN